MSKPDDDGPLPPTHAWFVHCGFCTFTGSGRSKEGAFPALEAHVTYAHQEILGQHPPTASIDVGYIKLAEPS